MDESDQAEFAMVALAHPLGLNSARGEEQIRFTSGCDFGDRSLTSVAVVPQGGLVWVMEGKADAVLDATSGACAESLEALDGRPPLGGLAFACIARQCVLGDDGIGAETARVSALLGGAAVAGCYTYGEIARTRGVSGFHNQTLVVLSIG